MTEIDVVMEPALPTYATAMNIDLVDVDVVDVTRGGRRRFDKVNALRLLSFIAGLVCIIVTFCQLVWANQLTAGCGIAEATPVLRLWMVTVMVNVFMLISLVLFREQGLPLFVLIHLCLFNAYIFYPVPSRNVRYKNCLLQDPHVIFWITMAYAPHVLCALFMAGVLSLEAFQCLKTSGIFDIYH